MRKNTNAENKKNTFWDIDEPLRNKLCFQIVTGILLIIISIIASFTFNLGQIMLLLCYLALFMIGKTFYQIYRCLSSKVTRFSGICTEIGNTSLFGVKTKNKYIILKTDTGLFFELVINTNFKPQINNRIVFYSPVNAIFQKNEDTYKVNNIYHIYIDRRNAVLSATDKQTKFMKSQN